MKLNIAPKVANTAFAGAAATLVVWLLGLFGVEMDATVAAALVVVLGGLVGYSSPPA